MTIVQQHLWSNASQITSSHCPENGSSATAGLSEMEMKEFYDVDYWPSALLGSLMWEAKDRRERNGYTASKM